MASNSINVKYKEKKRSVITSFFIYYNYEILKK